MQFQRLRPFLIAAISLAVIWLAAWAGYSFSRNSRMSGEKIRQYIRSVDFANLTAEQRRAALLALADKLNALPREERHRADWEDLWRPWFARMTQGEKEMFIDAALPTDVKQMIDSFERLPAEKRKKTIDEAMQNLKSNGAFPAKQPADSKGNSDPAAPPSILDPALVQQAETIGLKTFYTESSPETKAELAPLLEELQHQMESGRAFR